MRDKPKHIRDEEELVPEENETREVGEDEDTEVSFEAKIKTLRAKLTECQTEKAEHLETLQRTRADFLNSKRRLEEQLERDRERITNDLIADILPLIDSFETALNDKSHLEMLDATWRSGIEQIYAQAMNFLKRNETEAIATTGVVFNPYEHEAITNTATEHAHEVDTVTVILQKGYKRRDTIIRPAKVAVGSQA